MSDLSGEAPLVSRAAAEHDVGASHIPMDEVPLMHVGQGCDDLLGGGDDGQHVRLPSQGQVLAEPAPLYRILHTMYSNFVKICNLCCILHRVYFVCEDMHFLLHPAQSVFCL